MTAIFSTDRAQPGRLSLVSTLLQRRRRAGFRPVPAGGWWRGSRGAVTGVGLVGVALAAAVVGLGLAGLASAAPGGGPGGGDRFVGPAAGVAQGGDSVLVFGPRQLEVTGEGTAFHIEQFAVAVTPNTRHTVRVVNGNTSGGQRVEEATIRLNGDLLFQTDDWGEGPAVLEREVELLADNVLEVTLEGDDDGGTQFVTVTVIGTPDPTYPIFGPRRVDGVPGGVLVQESVALPAGAAPPYWLVVRNGAADGTGRVSAGHIVLNGVVVVRGGDDDDDDEVDDDDDEAAEPPVLNAAVGFLRQPVGLLAQNTLIIDLDGVAGSFVTVTLLATDTTPPVLTIEAPAPGLVTDQLEVVASGVVQDQTVTAVTIDGVEASVGEGGVFSATVALGVEGEKVLTFSAVDAAGFRVDSTRTVIRDTAPPVLTVSAPGDGLVTNQASVTVSGTVIDLTAVTVNANGVPLPVDGAGVFTGEVSLNAGANFVTVVATDAAGNSTTVVRVVTVDADPPVLAVSAPLDGETVTSADVAVSGTVQDVSAVTVTANGTPLVVDQLAGTFTGTVTLAEGPNTLTTVATDVVGNASTDSRGVTVSTGPALPPDPSTVASAIDPTVATTIGAATEFLYTGANPIQTGVLAGTIDPVRAAVVRGRVLDRNLQPLPGVDITVLGHPEFGQTRTRTDGAFDLALNGGGIITLDYVKDGFLPVQRKVDAPWQDYAPVEDVVMIGLDPQVTTVDLSSAEPVQVARGTPQTDQDGTRQATLLFMQGTTAEMVLPDGTTQPLTSLSVRATEYTVGPNGPQTMPALLPPTSGYTYAVELSADEALAAGAGDVRFSEPVAFYVENFIGFPVGLPVPVGSYDFGEGRWVPEDNGLVVEVLGATAGLADMDVDGDGLADGPATLAGLGISDAERERLGSLYVAGSSLWRVPLTHFSPIDANWPLFPDNIPPGVQDPEQDPDVDDECTVGGSIIGCQTQTLGERLGVTGTPYTLSYVSDRAPGRREAYTLNIPLTGDSIESTLTGVLVEMFVAGQVFTERFPAAPNLSTTFTWDGRDAYGRVVQGAQPVTVLRSYENDLFYAEPASQEKSFGLSCTGGTFEGQEVCQLPDSIQDRGQSVTRRLWFGTIGAWQAAQAAGLGGWNLDAHHAYDLSKGRLYLGDGRRRTAQAPVITTASLISAGDAAAAPDGSLYFVSGPRVRRLDADGAIFTVAGSDVTGFGGDGGLAVGALLEPAGVGLGPDGSAYIADGGNNRIRRVDPDGIITTIAGNGNCIFFDGGAAGEGGAALDAAICDPRMITVGPDGSVYFVQRELFSGGGMLDRIRRVGPDGVVVTVAGGESCLSLPVFSFSCPDGVPATQSGFGGGITSIALGPDGSLYVAHVGEFLNTEVRVRRIGRDGIVTAFAGDGTPAFAGDGGPAVEASVSDPRDLAVARDGTVYLIDGERIRRVGPDGIITTVAGCSIAEQPSCGVGGLARLTALDARHLAVAPDGGVFLTESNRILRMEPGLPGFGNSDFIIAAVDGSEVYGFDVNGRHLETLDALGTRRLAFDYNEAGLLATITDGDGNVTTVERDADGNATAVVAPFGQRTTLTLDTAGLLASVANPAAETVALTYHEGGLLATLTDPRGGVSRFTYDDVGRLIRDVNPAGGFITLERTELADGFEVVKTTALGDTTRYRVEQLPDGGHRRVNTSPNGLAQSSQRGSNGVTTSTTPDGTQTEVTASPDPRFGMQAPILSEVLVTTPGGLISTVQTSRQATLADPANPFSLETQVNALVVNGRTFLNTYSAVDRTMTATTPEVRERVVRLDSLGRVVEEVTAGITPVQYQRDARGRLARLLRGARQWTYGYAANGRLASVTDPLGSGTQYFHDAGGRLTRQVLPDGREVLFEYDANGNLTSVTPPGRPAHRFAYTAANLTATYAPPALDTGAWSTTFEYNADRNLTRILRPDGLEIGFTYDAAGRPSAVTAPDGTRGFSYDSTTGHLNGITGPDGGSLSLDYDGSLLTRVEWAGEVNGSVAASYDNDFRVTSLGVNGESPIPFGYDGDGLVTQAGDLSVTRDAANGLITSSTLGGVTESRTYTPFGELESLTVVTGGAPLLEMSYTRDALGRIIELTETVAGVTTTNAHTYDLAGRLMEVREDGMATAVYEYDANGNRVRLTTPSGTVTGTYDDQDRLVTYGEASYSHSRTGQLVTKTRSVDQTSYDYDVFGNLRRVDLPNGTVVEYLTDGLNRRVGKKVNGVLVRAWLYQDRLNPIAELDGSGQVVSRFVYGASGNVPDYMVRDGVTYRIISDHLGSVRLVVNASTGEVVQRLDFDAFGQVALNSEPGFQPFGFAGGLYDELTGLVRFGARDYDSETGRWTAKDPLGFSGADQNLYAYALNNPVSVTDVSGFAPCPCDQPLLVPLGSQLPINFNVGNASAPGGVLPLLAPDFASRVESLIFTLNQLGITPQVNSGFRSQNAQEWLRMQGYTNTEWSLHMTGNAIDLQILGAQGATIRQDLVAPIAELLNIEWGGDFRTSKHPEHFFKDPFGRLTAEGQKTLRAAAEAASSFYENCIRAR